ncbi:hypothetical protein MX551_004864 [Salmonella enterica]|nr:hypothetical protein [Salmonella enterica]EJB9128596.1 hypothetical protein [Salmonella enterica]EJB9180269.1 hypothetical protein [Salmonella enterica]EJC0020904.1 hypothetical protein [Salmonella enterica]EJC1070339.1 hypothetical protein [Salmonella enterica]
MSDLSNAERLGRYFYDSEIVRSDSDSKNQTFSISIPEGKYYVLKSISSQFGIPMSVIINIALKGFVEELLSSLTDTDALAIARDVDKTLADLNPETVDDEGKYPNYWESYIKNQIKIKDFRAFRARNKHIPDCDIDLAYDDYLLDRGDYN